MYNITKLHPLVWVFNQAMKDPKGMIEYYENNKEWEGWYTFGTMVPIYVGIKPYESFPTKNEWKQITQPDPTRTKVDEKSYVEDVLDLFYDGTKMYFAENSIVLPNYEFLSFSLAKYKTGSNMLYHTDYQQERAHILESKFHTTCLFYLNDNYEGGEISFAVMDDVTDTILDVIDYKPKEGDMVIFPSNLPIYHGVKPITSGEKYIIRTYWKTMPMPTEDWSKGVEEFGLEEWKKMQEEKAQLIRGHRDKTYKNATITLQGVKEEYL